MPDKHPIDDCTPCRIVSGTTLLGISLYIGYQARKFDSGLNRYGLMTISAVVCGLGAARLFQFYPFANFKKGGTTA